MNRRKKKSLRLHSSGKRDNKPSHPTDDVLVSGKCLEEGKSLGEFGEIRQSAQGAVKRKN